MFRLSVGILILLLFFGTPLLAAPAGNTSDPKLPYGEGIANLKNTIGTAKVSLDAESIIERKLKGASDITEAELEGEWYLLRVGYPIFNNRVEPYLKLGGAHLEASWKENGEFVLIKGDNEIAWGIGARALAYEIPQYKVKFVLDGQYRSCEPDISDVTVNNPSRTVSASEFKIDEWQIGGIVSMEFVLGAKKRYGSFNDDIYSLIPYIGLAYSDCNITGKFTFNNTAYDIGDADSDEKVVLITGCDIACPKNLTINVESRLVGETSVSGGATVKF